ncbi:hypothetical protein ACROYT_G014803 [Oculina patagonica]
MEHKEDHFTLPKEATPQVPIRPINSCIGIPTNQLSKSLASILKSLQSESGFPVKNAKEFTNFISSQVVAEDEQIVSFDVVSLFTSIPVDLAINIVQRKLGETTEWKALTILTQAQVLDLLSFVLNNSYFSSEGTQYHQVFGCAMVSPVSAVIAELVMEEIEKKALASASKITKTRKPNTSAEPMAEFKSTAVLPYVKGLSEQLRRCLRKQGVRAVFKSETTLRSQLVRPKDAVDSTKQDGVVYRIPCECGKVYIGETGRPMQDRIKEHDRDIRLARTQTSAVAEHTNNTGHYPLWNKVKFIDRDSHWYTSRVKEAIHIRLHLNNINRDSGIEIPEAWMPTIKKHNNRRTVRLRTAEGATVHQHAEH